MQVHGCKQIKRSKATRIEGAKLLFSRVFSSSLLLLSLARFFIYLISFWTGRIPSDPHRETHKKERILSLAQCLDRINVRDVCAAFKFIQGYTQKPLIIYFYFLFPLDFFFFHHVVVVVIVGLPRERERERPLMEAKKQGRALQDRHWALVGCGRPCDCTEIPSRGLCVCGDSPRGRQYFSLHFFC